MLFKSQFLAHSPEMVRHWSGCPRASYGSPSHGHADFDTNSMRTTAAGPSGMCQPGGLKGLPRRERGVACKPWQQTSSCVWRGGKVDNQLMSCWTVPKSVRWQEMQQRGGNCMKSHLSRSSRTKRSRGAAKILVLMPRCPAWVMRVMLVEGSTAPCSGTAVPQLCGYRARPKPFHSATFSSRPAAIRALTVSVLPESVLPSALWGMAHTAYFDAEVAQCDHWVATGMVLQ